MRIRSIITQIILAKILFMNMQGLMLKKHPEGTEVPVSLDVSVEDVVKEAHGQLD